MLSIQFRGRNPGVSDASSGHDFGCQPTGHDEDLRVESFYRRSVGGIIVPLFPLCVVFSSLKVLPPFLRKKEVCPTNIPSTPPLEMVHLFGMT